MANLNETDDFPAGIYQLEDTDPVKGGAPNEATKAGVDNIPHHQLARRTRWLKTRVDTLLASVVAASTAVAGIVRLTDSVTSTSTTTAATANAAKAANDNANTRAYKTTTISAEGLATGGGALDANRTITVADASQAEAEAGTATNRAMSPLRVAQAITGRLGAFGLPTGVIVSDLNAAVSGIATGSTPDNSPVTNPVVLTMGRDSSNRAQLGATAYAGIPRLFLRNTTLGGGYTSWAEAWLGQQAAQSLGASGYQRLPSGLLMQWGQFTGVTSASPGSTGIYDSSIINVTWPVAFSSTVFQALLGASADGGGAQEEEQVFRRGVTLTGGQFSVASRVASVSMTGSYLVIGV